VTSPRDMFDVANDLSVENKKLRAEVERLTRKPDAEMILAFACPHCGDNIEPAKPGECLCSEAFRVLVRDIGKLRATNERLRSALREIQEMGGPPALLATSTLAGQSEGDQ
jgi:hypothetical protein